MTALGVSFEQNKQHGRDTYDMFALAAVVAQLDLNWSVASKGTLTTLLVSHEAESQVAADVNLQYARSFRTRSILPQ
jgi:hypothetical protein